MPVGWESVSLTEEEMDAMIAAADAGDLDLAERIVGGAYAALSRPPRLRHLSG